MSEMNNMIDMSKEALLRVKELREEENNPDLKLRIFVQGGGCSGFQYGFVFDEIAQEDDFEIEKEIEGNTVKLLVDSMSLQYLQGASIDFVENLYGTQFVIRNPNASSTCGCGASFSV